MLSLTLVLMMVVYFPIIYGWNNSLCGKFELCKCVTTSASKVHINCHQRGLNLSSVCGICTTFRHVQLLDVSRNDLVEIPKSCFENCTELEELHLDSNGLSGITKGAFTGLTSLTRLYINNNNLIRDGKIHDPELFKPLNMLEELQIQNNSDGSQTATRKYLSNVVNNTLGNLKCLHLDGVPNGYFGPNFAGFHSLTNINFSGSAIFNITNETFRNVPHIQTLDMSYCKLKSIEADTFKPLRDLRYLNLSNNMALGFPSLRNVSYGLRDSRSIEILDYSKVYKTFGLTTQLNRCDVWYLQNTSLKELHINSNRMASIELNALHLSPLSLETVFAEDNRITFGPYAFQAGCLTNLKRIELNRQQIAHAIANYNNEMEITENKLDSSGGCPVQMKLPKSACRLGKHKPLKPSDFTFPSTLETIGYSLSNLRYQRSGLPKALPLRNSIKSVDFSYNVMYTWSDPLVIFSELKFLNLSHNFCFNITSEFFRNCPNLENLDASYNRIAQVLENDTKGSIFESLTSLRILNVSACWIEKLPEMVFKPFISLEHLDLSYNMLEKLEFRFQHMNNLSSISLRHNKISTLPLNLLEHLKNSSEFSHRNITIDLSGNMLDAENCENLKFLSWLMQYPIYFTNIDAYTFKTENGEISFQDLQYAYSQKQDSCDKIYMIISLITSLFIMVMIGIIIGGIIYRYRWRLRYFYYMTKARYGGYIPEENSDTDRLYEFDVFISYAEEDYKFVTGEMYTRLTDAGLTLCLHQKDFPPGRPIADNIFHAVTNSKITLVVLSPAFLESEWCLFEFNMARTVGIYSRRGNIICVVIYKPFDVARASLEMREYFESDSYSQYPDSEEERTYFWHMLIPALGGQIVTHIQ